MSRGKNIGGLSEETKKDFKRVELEGDFSNHEETMRRLIVLFSKYNKQYEADLKMQGITAS